MTDTPEHLDPDEVECPKCGSPPREVCRQPSGAKAKAIHVERRRAANPDYSTSGPRRIPKATPASRSKGGKASADARRRRKELLARRAADAEEAAIAEEADKLARDAARYAVDRSTLKAVTLKNALGIAHRLDEAIEHLRRPRSFVDGKPATIKVEVFDAKTGLPAFDKHGDRVLVDRPDEVGFFSVDQIETLAKAAASALNSVRVEEGKPTGIHEHLTAGGAREILGDTGTAELIAFAAQHLTDNDPKGKP